MLKVLCWKCWKLSWLKISIIDSRLRTEKFSRWFFECWKVEIVERLWKEENGRRFSTLSTLKVVENRLQTGNKLKWFNKLELTKVNFPQFFNVESVEKYISASNIGEISYVEKVLKDCWKVLKVKSYHNSITEHMFTLVTIL